MPVDIRIPPLGESITEATIVRWLKKIGDPIQVGEGIVEVETDKATFPVEAPVRGRLAAILAPEGAVVRHGQQLGVIEPE